MKYWTVLCIYYSDLSSVAWLEKHSHQIVACVAVRVIEILSGKWGLVRDNVRPNVTHLRLCRTLSWVRKSMKNGRLRFLLIW